MRTPHRGNNTTSVFSIVFVYSLSQYFHYLLHVLLSLLNVVLCVSILFQPTKVLGIYTFTKRVALEDFENKPRKQQGYSTVSHFNIVHYDCHLAAVRYGDWHMQYSRCTLSHETKHANIIYSISLFTVSDSHVSCLGYTKLSVPVYQSFVSPIAMFVHCQEHASKMLYLTHFPPPVSQAGSWARGVGERCSPECQHQVQWAAPCVGAACSRICLCHLLSKVKTPVGFSNLTKPPHFSSYLEMEVLTLCT